LSSPEQVTIDGDGNIWVADSGSGVLKFSPDGDLLAKWDTRGIGDGEFDHPMGIAVDAQGRVFVADQAARVQVFSSDGAYLGRWGSTGFAPGQFGEPAHLVLDGIGHIYVVDLIGDRVQKFRLLPPFGP
jgi:tripartite motif-containing protein 71